jgi:hypothetical protein
MTRPDGSDERGMASSCKTAGSAYVGSNPTPATTSAPAPSAQLRAPAGPPAGAIAVSGHVRRAPTATGRPRNMRGTSSAAA